MCVLTRCRLAPQVVHNLTKVRSDRAGRRPAPVADRPALQVVKSKATSSELPPPALKRSNFVGTATPVVRVVCSR